MAGVSRVDAAAATLTGLRAGEAGPFLARLVRLDSAALVRVRPAGPDTVTLWGRVPWGVLVARTAGGVATGDLTVPAGALLDLVRAGRDELPDRRDGDWVWPLPPGAGAAVESVPATELVRLGEAAARTLRSAQGRIGERMLRDALLDHVAITVEPAGGGAPGASGAPVEVRQGLVQAMLRMGFVVTENVEEITIRTVRNWVGLAGRYGEVWLQTRANLAVHIVR